jgi:hypothetical protein
MRAFSVGAAMAVGLILASHAHAQLPTNVHQVAKAGNGFDLGITKLLAAPANLFTSVTGIGASSKSPPPIVRPQQLPARNNTLSAFLPKPQMPRAKPIMGLSTYPSQDQMPGAAYLKAFGAQVAPRVRLD